MSEGRFWASAAVLQNFLIAPWIRPDGVAVKIMGDTLGDGTLRLVCNISIYMHIYLYLHNTYIYIHIHITYTYAYVYP